MSIGGYTVVRNGIALDYCFREAIASLSWCDEVVVCDSDSTDGTSDALDDIASQNPNVHIVNWPWPAPVGQSGAWFEDWLNVARSHLSTDYQVALDADEVLDPACVPLIQAAARQEWTLACTRLNFWQDHRHLLTPGQVCGAAVVRCAPTHYYMLTDAGPFHGPDDLWKASRPSAVRIFHYGFLRGNDAMVAKIRTMAIAYDGNLDPRVEQAASEGVHWTTYTPKDLQPYHGPHPECAHGWLRAHGYEP